MSNKLSIKDIVKRILNIVLWAGIILPMLFYVYLFIKQFMVHSEGGFGFLDTLFGAWTDCSKMLLKLLIISGIFIVIKIIVFLPGFFRRVQVYKQGVSVCDVIVSESLDKLDTIDSEEFLNKYAAAMYNPVEVVALLPLALYRLTTDFDAGRKMLSIILNDDESSEKFELTLNAVKKQLEGKEYICNSYFEGAVPENGYKISSTPTVSVKISDSISDVKYERTLYIGCGGSGSYRPVTLKQVGKSALKKSSNSMLKTLKANDDIWFIDDFPSILVNVKPPQAAK